MPRVENEVLQKIMQLFNDDCLKVLPTIPDKSIDLILTDPPYGTTACKWDSIISFEPMWKELKRIIKDNSAIALFGNEPFSSHLRLSNLDWFKYDWIWNKISPIGHLICKYKPLQQTELISIFSKSACSYVKNKNSMNYYPIMKKRDKKRKFIRNTNKSKLVNNHTMSKTYLRDDYEYKYPTNIINISNANRTNKKHPTQKPVVLLEYLIKTYTNENDTVLDFTMGSGSTGVACKNLNREFIGIELDKNYFNIAKQRIESTLF